MKFLLYIFLLLSSYAFADEWTVPDTYREITYQSLAAIDWLQTRTGAKNPEEWCEINSYLGCHPSVQSVNIYFALTGLAHVAIAKALPEKYRAPFQYITIGIEAGAVGRNYLAGIRITF